MSSTRAPVGALLLALTAGAGAQAQSPGQVPLYDNLGNHHYPISTAVPLAQRYFDQGLRLYYAFNHAESIRAFREAARLDPACAMCAWGEALAWGPNINLPMDSAAGVAAHAAVERAVELATNGSAREAALIQALSRRYVAQPLPERASLDTVYARAMAEVVQWYPADVEAATLYAESLMNLSPWKYWNRDRSPRPGTPEILAQLERVMATSPDHPGANHFFIHALEEVYPERAVEAAERLAGLMPGAGHLVHMPGHIYIRVGRYADAIAANEHAVHADETYIRDARPGLGVYTAGYYPHNYDFLAFAASMIGRAEQAVQAAETVAELVPMELMGAPGMTFLEHFSTRHLQLKVRFGLWEVILNAEAPPESQAHARAMWHYARGRALAATGDVAGGDAELERLRAFAAEVERAGLALEFNAAADVLAIAVSVLEGQIAAARNDYATATDRLQTAVRLQDELVYGEPPEWTVPVRQDLGRVLLDAGRPTEAEQAFRQDLERFPDNTWSLKGLSEALRAQGLAEQADELMDRYQRVRTAGR